jgi:pimeloyl-ACP methyl ester carboxylesterase
MLIAPLALRAAPADSGVVPRFEAAPCPDLSHSRGREECGRLIVWENRARAVGRLVRIPVMIFRSLSTHPAADPVLFMIGGPGGSIRQPLGSAMPYRESRDVILLDQRGTRATQPALECPAIDRIKLETAYGRLRDAAVTPAWLAAAGQCADAYRAAGISVSEYHTRAIAADVEDLRRALGIAQWNLYGVSYSGRVMLTVMRDFPAAIRSVILDSPLGLDSRYDEMAPAGFDRALRLAFAECAVSPACSARHPAGMAAWTAAVDHFDRTPQWVTFPIDSTHRDSSFVDGSLAASVLTGALDFPDAIGLIPLLVERTAAGDLGLFRRLLAKTVGPSKDTEGMRLVVWCAEVVPFEDRARIAGGHDRRLGFAGARFETVPPEACEPLHLLPPPPSEGQPVSSTIPTLILAGQFDPYVPSSSSRALLSLLTRAFHIEIPGASHGPGYDACGSILIDAFLNQPDRLPAADCLGRAAGAVFTR